MKFCGVNPKFGKKVMTTPKTRFVTVKKHMAGHMKNIRVAKLVLALKLGEEQFQQAMAAWASGAVLHWHPKYKSIAALSRRGWQTWYLRGGE